MYHFLSETVVKGFGASGFGIFFCVSPQLTYCFMVRPPSSSHDA